MARAVRCVKLNVTHGRPTGIKQNAKQQEWELMCVWWGGVGLGVGGVDRAGSGGGGRREKKEGNRRRPKKQNKKISDDMHVLQQ